MIREDTSKHDHGKNGAAAELYGYCGEGELRRFWVLIGILVDLLRQPCPASPIWHSWKSSPGTRQAQRPMRPSYAYVVSFVTSEGKLIPDRSYTGWRTSLCGICKAWPPLDSRHDCNCTGPFLQVACSTQASRVFALVCYLYSFTNQKTS